MQLGDVGLSSLSPPGNCVLKQGERDELAGAVINVTIGSKKENDEATVALSAWYNIMYACVFLFPTQDYRISQIDLFTEPEGLGILSSYFDDTEEMQGFGVMHKTCSIKVHWGT